MSSGRGEETVMERYLRLKEEVAALVSDVEHIEAAQDSSEKLSQVSPVDLLEDVRRHLCNDSVVTLWDPVKWLL